MYTGLCFNFHAILCPQYLFVASSEEKLKRRIVRQPSRFQFFTIHEVFKRRHVHS